MNGKPMWIVLMLKDKYAQNFEKNRLRNDLMHALGYAEDEIIYTPFDRDQSVSYYFFAVDRPGRHDQYDILSLKPDVFDPFSKPMRLTDDQVRGFIASCQESVTPKNIGYGDIVFIKTGKYSKLNGIVLRKTSSGQFDVGLKMCFGKVIETYRPADLSVVGNIFRYIKVPR